MDGEGDGGRWVTYAELADARGISRKAAIRMTHRHQWRRQPGNDGMTRVWVTDAALTKTGRQTARQDGADDTPGMVTMLAAIEAAHAGEVAALRGERDAAKAIAAEAVIKAERAEQALAAERSRGDALRERLDGADAWARTAEEAAEALRRAEGRAAGAGAATARLGRLARPLGAGGAARLIGGARRAVGGLYPRAGDRDAAEGETKIPGRATRRSGKLRAGTFRTPPTSEGWLNFSRQGPPPDARARAHPKREAVPALSQEPGRNILIGSALATISSL